MKINPMTGAVRFLNEVRERQEQQGKGSRDQRQNHQNPGQDQDSYEVTEEKVGEAIESFRTDSQTQASGLNASVAGNGPGLRVVLRDGSGAVVRQMTGEEFLRLREAASSAPKGAHAPGKILDRKL